MNAIDHLAVQAAQERAKEQRLCKRLAAALVIRLQIAPGQYLGPLLGASEAVSNEAAVEAWVGRHLYSCREESDEQAFQELSGRLLRVLSCLNDD